MKIPQLSRLACAAMLAAAGAQAAPTLLVDRGLPTINLNNAAGASRSNVSWTENTGPTSGGLYIDGDSFTNTSALAWSLTSLRVWAVEPNITSASLWGGVAGSSINLLPSAGQISNVKYVNGADYQGSSGTMYQMQQIDFAVNITLAAGETYQFFLDGLGADFNAPFAHASNAALSGSPQDGADNKLLWGTLANGGLTVGGEWTSNQTNVWDKTSDINVQVFGNAIPEPSSYALAGVALLALGATRRRRA